MANAEGWNSVFYPSRPFGSILDKHLSLCLTVSPTGGRQNLAGKNLTNPVAESIL
jgi:hypothetical protein